MAGYSYYHVSMSQISGGQPFAPFVPSQFNRNDPTKKKIVPVTSRPYHDSDDDDDGEWNQQRQPSPPRGHPSNSQGNYISNKESIGSTINKPDGYDNGISYGRKEGTKPSFVGAIQNDNHDGYDDYKEGPKSKPKANSSPIYNSGYGGYGHDKPFGTPRNTKLSKPTNDIDEAIGFLKEEAANRGYNEWHKQPKYEADNNPHQRIYDGSGPLPRRPMQADKKDMDLVNEIERLKKINVPLIKNNRPPSNFSDGKSSNSGVIDHKEAEKRFNGMIIDHKEAEKKFNGMTI